MNIKNTPARMWSNKTEMLDEFLSWVYDRMSSADQKKKDVAFRRYYRYYNDGDYHRLKLLPGMNSEETLEYRTAEVALKLYLKYATPEARREFYVAREQDNFEMVHAPDKYCCGNHHPGKMQPYWIRNYVKKHAKGTSLDKKIEKIEKLREKLMKAEAAVAKVLNAIHEEKTGK